MRVVLVNTLFPPITVGGAEESVMELARHLGERGHEVTVACLGPRSEPVEEIPTANVTVARLGTNVVDAFTVAGTRSLPRRIAWHSREAWRPRVQSFLRALIDDAQPDVVHTHSIAGFGTAAWLAAAGRPLVHTIRDYYLLCVSTRTYEEGRGNCLSRCVQCRVLRSPQRLVRSRPDVYVGISEAVLTRHREFGYLHDDDRTAVVHNQPQVAAQPAREPGPEGGVAFGFIGRMAEYKGLWKVLDAFRQVQGAQHRFVIAGDGDDDAQEELAVRLAADERIVHLGRVPKESFYRQVDVVLVPSQWHEPYGRVAAEAARAGRRVLVSAAGGLPEAVADLPGHEVVEDYQAISSWVAAMRAAVTETRAATESPPTAPQEPVADQYVEIYRRLVAEPASF
jgi:glycosyltransferase involved in cell wall biosynthesis